MMLLVRGSQRRRKEAAQAFCQEQRRARSKQILKQVGTKLQRLLDSAFRFYDAIED
jgi:hypothetical protein